MLKEKIIDIVKEKISTNFNVEITLNLIMDSSSDNLYVYEIKPDIYEVRSNVYV